MSIPCCFDSAFHISALVPKQHVEEEEMRDDDTLSFIVLLCTSALAPPRQSEMDMRDDNKTRRQDAFGPAVWVGGHH